MKSQYALGKVCMQITLLIYTFFIFTDRSIIKNNLIDHCYENPACKNALLADHHIRLHSILPRAAHICCRCTSQFIILLSPKNTLIHDLANVFEEVCHQSRSWQTHTQNHRIKQYLHAQWNTLLHQCNMASTILLHLC